VGYLLPGVINITTPWVKASGALAVMLLVYRWNPPRLPNP